MSTNPSLLQTKRHQILKDKAKNPKQNTIKMQASSCFVQPFSPPKSSFKTKDFPAFSLSSPAKLPPTFIAQRILPVKAALSFNYNSAFSVFMAEACETIGGEACAANMFPEAKLKKAEVITKTNISTIEQVDRDYFDYDSEPYSVLRAEACDDLVGEFCKAP